MTTSVTITATHGNNRPLDELEKLIAQRVKAMRGETTENAVIATAITVLTSIRARTKVADPKKDTGGVIVSVRADLTQSFRQVGGSRVVCIRHGKRGEVDTSHPFVCLPGRFTASTAVYMVRDLATANLKVNCDYYIISNSKGEAEDYAQKRHNRRVASHAGMAKWALGLAQSKVSNRPVAMNMTTTAAQGIATQNVDVTKQGNGYSSGSYSVTVSDALRYALLAMPGGEADLTLALEKAANSTAAKIRKVYDLGFADSVPTPFPEIAHK